MKRILISGAGGFIGGYLASHFLKNDQVELICADIKPKDIRNHNQFDRLLSVKGRK